VKHSAFQKHHEFGPFRTTPRHYLLSFFFFSKIPNEITFLPLSSNHRLVHTDDTLVKHK
jgi:hypothetical protein